jgi:hypothetical protein
MAEQPQDVAARVAREEKNLAADTERAGGIVHEFDPDASPAEKAAGVKKVPASTLVVVLKSR